MSISLLGGPDAGVEGVDIEAQDEQPAAQVGHPSGVVGSAGDDPPGFMGSRAGGGNPADDVQAPRVLEVAGHAQHLAQVGWADEQQVHIRDRGDLLDPVQGGSGFNLDADERFGVGLSLLRSGPDIPRDREAGRNPPDRTGGPGRNGFCVEPGGGIGDNRWGESPPERPRRG